MSKSSCILAARAVSFGYGPGEPFLRSFDASFVRGRLYAVVGPNGAGKSTFLRLLVGLHMPAAGAILLEDRPLANWSTRQRAQRLAFVPQRPSAPEATSAEEIVRRGRYPHRGLGLFESPDDMTAVKTAMRQTGTSAFAERDLATLSGGEAQRVHLAAALAQEPAVLLLDEPAAELDLFHQLHLYDVLGRVCRRRNICVIVVTHDLNHAAHHADEVLLLQAGRLVERGRPHEVLTPQKLEPIYGVRFTRLEGDNGRTWLLATAASAAAVIDGEQAR